MYAHTFGSLAQPRTRFTQGHLAFRTSGVLVLLTVLGALQQTVEGSERHWWGCGAAGGQAGRSI